MELLVTTHQVALRASIALLQSLEANLEQVWGELQASREDREALESKLDEIRKALGLSEDFDGDIAERVRTAVRRGKRAL